MQQAGRYQAILELLEAIFNSLTPADKIINNYMRERKYIGSKDRRFIADTVWDIIRNRMKLEFVTKSNQPRSLLLQYIKQFTMDDPTEIFSGEKYAPSKLSPQELELLSTENDEPYPPYVEAETPKWIFEKINDVEFLKALNQPAMADFRINVKNRDKVISELASEGYEVEPCPYSPIGIRSLHRISLGNCMAYQNGEIEVQDEASQIAAIMCDVNPNHKIIDYCCGAGGKSLALAYLMNNQGKILAHDISSSRLEEIKPRMQRLGIKNIELTDIIADTDRDFDRFILDAPCSGSGTWRRCPDAKFRLTPEHLQKLNQTQSELLDIAYNKTKSGGRIIYITCSIFKDENENIVEPFVKAHADLRLLNLRSLWEQKLSALYPCHSNEYLRLSPLSTGTDGFFLAVIEKI